MKDYTDLFDELYVLDMTNMPLSDDDYDEIIRCNLHRQYFNDGEDFVLVGTHGGLHCFILNYATRHRKYGRLIDYPVLLKSLF